VYTVVVVKQPTSPAQPCVVARSRGKIRGADVTDIGISCSVREHRGRARALPSHGPRA
jgi:hypothetical protein